METYKQFYLEYYKKLRFINSIDKIPKSITKLGTYMAFDEWPKKTLKENYKLEYFKRPDEIINSSSNIGYRMIYGKQLDDSYIICFDFDINSKNEHRHHVEELFDKLTKNNFDGVYQTSTEGNYQMLINIKDEHHLNYIKSIKKYDSNEEICTFESNCEELKGLEFVLKTHIVLPPSKTKCKTTNIYRKRKFLSNNFTRVMDDDLFNVLKTAYERYIEQKQIKSSNKQNINKTKTFIENTQEELIYLTSTEIAKIEKMCNIIDHKYIDTYIDWFQLIYSLSHII